MLHVKKFESDEVPRLGSVVDQVVNNSRNGRGALSGLSLYRGGKDPDIGSGSFSDAFKHGSLIPEVAQGYASNANGTIGFRSPDTDKFGFVAKFRVPPGADEGADGVRFYKNFGIEDAAPGVSMKEASRQLDALVRSSQNPHEAVERFITEQMYEARIPARIKPDSVWLLEKQGPADEFSVCRRPDLEALAAQIAAERGARLICPNLHRLVEAIGMDPKESAASSKLLAYASTVRKQILADSSRVRQQSFETPSGRQAASCR